MKIKTIKTYNDTSFNCITQSYQLRYDMAMSYELGTDLGVIIVEPYTGSAPITVQAGNYHFIFMLLNLARMWSSILWMHL